jgi:hypothetical protein
MQVPIQKVLTKMQEEIERAKHSNNEGKVREHLLVIRSLCELVIEQESNPEKPKQSMVFSQQPSLTTQASKLKEDEGNGDSIFDF